MSQTRVGGLYAVCVCIQHHQWCYHHNSCQCCPLNLGVIGNSLQAAGPYLVQQQEHTLYSWMSLGEVQHTPGTCQALTTPGQDTTTRLKEELARGRGWMERTIRLKQACGSSQPRLACRVVQHSAGRTINSSQTKTLYTYTHDEQRSPGPGPKWFLL